MACEVAAAAAENSIIGVDRFSILPDEIAHNIMSRFSFKDLTRLGCVSKRCKQLQLSAPFISLAVGNFRRDENLGNVLDSFNNFMIQRGDNKIHTFEFKSIYADHVEPPPLSAWINSAVRCNVEKLSAVLYPTPDVLFTFPSALFVLGSLKSLKLNINCVIGGEVSFSPSLSNLESLELSNVSVIDESFWRWISCSCKRLQNLNLVDIYGSENIIIESPSLKKGKFHLYEGDCCNLSLRANRLEDISIQWGCTGSNSSVNIFAPKVKFFSWLGIFPSHLNLEKMSFLNEGCISSDGEVTELAIVVDVLWSMRCVKTLRLTDCVLKALSKDGFPFAPLNELRCLTVPCDLTDELVPGLVHLLRRTPNLECLCLNTHARAYHIFEDANIFEDAHYGGFDMEFWKQQKLAFVDCLKNMAIILDGGSNAFDFAGYILKHARNLKRMDIFCDPNLYDEVMKLQDEMISSGTLICHQVKENKQFLFFEAMSEFLERANWYG